MVDLGLCQVTEKQLCSPRSWNENELAEFFFKSGASLPPPLASSIGIAAAHGMAPSALTYRLNDLNRDNETQANLALDQAWEASSI